jgi:cysteine-rich repeat protein
VWDGQEECDDGNEDDTDDCPSTCAVPTCGDGFTWADNEECDDGNDDPDDACANDCTANNCLQDWLAGEFECNEIYGSCTDEETGYHWKGLYVQNNQQYACWWHTKNQGWNTSSDTNFYALAEHFLLETNKGTSRWCYSFASDPCQSGACAVGPQPNSYFQQNNVGAWGWCGGAPWQSGGFVCIPAPEGVECGG